MYADFFGLKQAPFSIAPDPHYLFMSERHREALAHLLYGLDGGGGFVLLTGEIGAGKTTVCRCFLEQVPAHCQVAYIFNPKLSVLELLRTVCDEFRVAVPATAQTVKDFVDPLNAFLLQLHASGRNAVLIIDEAQNLSADVLEQLRLLTNLETNERKLLQIILIGQPELRTMLARPELEQLAQRVIARFHLEALSEPETGQYIQHRLTVAGLAGPVPFTPAAIRRIHQITHGVPRRINLLCDRAMLGAYATGTRAIGPDIVVRAAHEVFDHRPTAPEPPLRRAQALGLALVASALLGAGLLWAWQHSQAPAPSAAARPMGPASSAASAVPVSASAAAPAAAPPSTVAPARPAAIHLDALPANASRAAWDGLLRHWEIAPVNGESACSTAARQGLGCLLSTTGSLDQLRSLDRPAVLTLHLPGRGDSAVLLTGLSATDATLALENGPRRLALVELALAWQGEFGLLWRLPPGYAADGSRSPALAPWLDEHLQAALPPQAASSPVTTRLRAFQARHGLRPDGRLGPVTLMQLNRAAGIPEPTLTPDTP
ncbi:AAA family ATPase [Ideonella sp. B7]|uniref:ExeA family protein n=1 Tax=Ideonella benzenivorans TaxID=2831643 RepID=UPI001CED6C2D|nr:ExeA family protein [Ideonella benzenivorans]MCA6216010.1 AAA family ATPase [Ideonella benzenivorans]